MLSVAVKLKEAELLPVVDPFSGPEVMKVSGSVVSMVQLKVAGLPVLPAVSVALTEKVCGPWARPE